ncbi:Uncharacterised protein [Mycobacteroides abscessus subsp. abscessus]|nr:Uncharacterised protein [Mycobacteroides abscessus subsp. abscessus]
MTSPNTRPTVSPTTKDPAKFVLNIPSTRPMNKPSHAPLSMPPPSTLGQDRRPVTRSTCIRFTPTIVTFSTGNCSSDR